MEMINRLKQFLDRLKPGKQPVSEISVQERDEYTILKAENEELKRTVDMLTVKNKEIQQLMVSKIKETDSWTFEQDAKYKEAIRKAEEL